MSGTRTKLVVDLATDRIIWFGSMDVQLEETHIVGAAIAYYDGPLPTNMRAGNSWGYRFIDQKIVPPIPKTNAHTQTTLDASRDVLLKLMDAKIEERRRERDVPMTVPDLLLLLDPLNSTWDLRDAIYITKRTQALRDEYRKRVQSATSSAELLELRNEFIEELHEI